MKEKTARFEQLLVIYLKRDWKKIALWILLLGLFAAGFVPAFEEILQGDGLTAIYYTMDNPALVAMVGSTPIHSPGQYTLGAMYAQEMLLFTALISAIVSALHVVARTRKEEESGISEIINAFQIGRQANSVAVTLEVLLINSLLALLTMGVLMLFNIPSITAEGSVLFAVAVGLAGLLGAMIALVVAQIMPTSGGAVGGSMALIGTLYMGRAMTDIVDASLSRFNPLGWTYLIYPFTENNGHYLICLILLSAVLLVIALLLEGNRDLGEGYLPQRTGRQHASKSLQSVTGLFIRLNRGMILSWLIAFLLMGVAYGSIYGDLQVFVEGNDLIAQVFQAENMSMEASFTGVITLVMVGLAAILPIAIVNRLFTEEREIRLNQVFATKVSRLKMFTVTISLAFISGVLGVLVGSVGLAVSALASIEDTANIGFGDFIVPAISQMPYILFFIGLAALALGFFPKLGKYTYIYLAFSFFVVYLKDLIGLPTWVVNLSVQAWLPQMPIEAFELTIFIGLTLLSLVMIVVGYIGYNRRDLIEEM